LTNGNLITGLDVGTTKICAVIAEVSDGACPNVIGVGMSPCNGLKKGVVVDLASTSAAIKDAIENAERMAGEEVQSVVVGITGEHISCVNNRSVVAINRSDGEIGGNDVARLMDAAKVIVLPPEREIVHAIPRWYSVDGQTGIHSPVGMHGTRLEMETHIVTGLSSFIQNVVKCVHMVGFSVDGTVLEPLAAAESVLVPAERELGVMLVDIGGGTSDVAIYIDGEIYYSGVIPVGGNHFTKDLAVGLRTSLEEAERIKVQHGQSVNVDEGLEPFEFAVLASDRPRHLPKKVLVEIIEPRLTELCQLVVDQIDLAGCRDRLPAGLVFTGGGSQLNGAADLASSVTGLPARIAKPVGFSGLVDAVSNPACATAAGLVLFWNKYYSAEGKESENILMSLLRHIREFLHLDHLN
jgi:cell division protein FtsA